MTPATVQCRTACGQPRLLAVIRTTLVAALAATLSLSLHAQTASTTGTSDDQVIVIGSRFANAPDLAPIGATVITASDIQNAGVSNANEAVRKLAGVYGRQNLSGTQDYDLDMNGFGTDSANNLVILVDGIRMSESEQAVAVLSQIPVDSIARIEIMHNGSSVLYGDGATGGVIQVITKRLGQTDLTGSVVAGLGQFNDHTGRAYLSRGWENLNLSLNLADQKTDNYRSNNWLDQKNASGTLTWFGNDLRAGLRFDIAHQDGGLPGSLTLAAFGQNPRQSSTPFDNGYTDIDRYSGFVEQTVGKWQFNAELSTRERTVGADYVSLASTATYTGRQTEFTPRVRYLDVFGDVHNELVAGLDLMNWNRQTNASFSMAYATQKSQAAYLRDEARIGDLRVALGARHELFDKTSTDPSAFATDNYSVKQGVNAWEAQASYAFLPAVLGFANAGQSYRVANVDDNAYTTTANTPLLPQLSHDLEVGATLGDSASKLTARWFRHDLTDEIYYDPTANGGYGANANLDPTRREGVALDWAIRVAQAFRLTAQAQHVAATFSAGSNEGKQLVLAPANTLSMHLNWLPGDGQSAYIGGQWVDTQRYGGDFANTCAALIPAHATLDARYAHAFGAWEVAATGNNLTDRHYFSNAFECQGGIYPDDGRRLALTVRYSF